MWSSEFEKFALDFKQRPIHTLADMVFKPAFWYAKDNPVVSLNSVLSYQFLRMLPAFLTTLLTFPFKNGEFLSMSFENWGVFSVALVVDLLGSLDTLRLTEEWLERRGK